MRIEFFEERGNCCMTVSPGEEGKTRVLCPWANAAQIRDEFGAALREARDELDSVGAYITLETAYNFLAKISSAGIAAIQDLFGDAIDDLKPIFAPAMHRVPRSITSESDFPMLQIQMPINFIQLEALPLIAMRDLEPFRSADDLMRAAMCFPGFCFVVHRLDNLERDADSRLSATPRVPVKMFRHADFSGSDDEAVVLAREFDLDGQGAWPDTNAGTKADALRAMVQYEESFRKTPKSTDQIHHFSCHSDVAGAHPILELKANGGQPIQVSTRDFGSRFRIARDQQQPKLSLPLAFLNACTTNGPNSYTPTTWANTLIHARYRGVISTEAPVPDAFAAQFSRSFYGELAAGRTVGQALQRSKWTLLQRWNNPFGLLYTFFGDPDLRIR